jgi:hypothetical protein
MKPADVTSVLATRRTVRITYSRATELHTVAVVQGDEVLETIREGVIIPELAERYAATAAATRGLDIASLDVP